jgi:protein gp37
MASNSNIEWTDVTDNIIRVLTGGWWCRKISEGCAHCYAEQLNKNAFFGGNMLAYTGESPKLELQEKLIASWARQTKARKHFVCSMTDVFGDWVPFEWALIFLRGMWRAPKQTFQVLTKRPEVAANYVSRWLKLDGLTRVPSNIMIGASIENQKWANERLPELVKIPGKLFISAEPLLGPVRFDKIRDDELGANWNTLTMGICWVIFGGESGQNARPCNVDWIRDGVRQCRAAGVKPFVKQLGQRTMQTNPSLRTDILYPQEEGHPHSQYWPKLRDKKGGDMSEWPNDLKGIREFPC